MSGIVAEGGWAPGYLSVPLAGGGPGVVVLHDWWGLDEHARSVVDQLAREGRPAFAPDLYQGRATDDPDEAARLAGRLETGDLPSELLDAVEVVRALPGASGPVAVVGLGLGGALALYLASLRPDVGAVVCHDGFPPPEAPLALSRVRAAVLGHTCEPEFHRAGHVQAELRAAGVEVSFCLYPGAAHGFLDATRTHAHDPAAAALSWRRTMAFLREHAAAATVTSPAPTAPAARPAPAADPDAPAQPLGAGHLAPGGAPDASVA